MILVSKPGVWSQDPSVKVQGLDLETCLGSSDPVLKVQGHLH